ncbi:nuclear pore complex subunit Nro1-domain-containing protein [Halteromyces radiatus]|uniref:nuclear pore complex subunit Nro1-domain-containing protein n=1 Tax=Halteromyces radiatus TaxID=101107 RepID=UPI00221F4D20|nr:nuclear pore complex subunit Nro1-domain-containing protein [Halteromyces radiatus]KAI8083064.1 nuclear pore complex subunit Nro1-domain-containing protein [Halteromyces radiatus]
MPAEKKRPRGLKSSAAASKSTPKKVKTEVDEKDIPENAQTVVIDKVVEEGDEVGEAAALFENALEKLDKNPSEALTLLRGTVHESDRILRNWESEQPLPSLFYYTYGSALYELGRLTEEEEFTPYLEAAEERLQDGFDHLKKIDQVTDDEVVNKMNITLAKIWLAKAAMLVDDDSTTIPDLAVRALETLDKTCEKSKVSTANLVEIGSIVQNHGDLYSVLEPRTKFTQWAEILFKRILDDEPNNARVLSELGLSQLSLGNYWLERMDEKEDVSEQKEDRTERINEEQKAYDAFVEAKKYFLQAQESLEKSKTLTPQIFSDLAEAYLNEANLTLDSKEQKELYEQAVKNINEAKNLGSGLDYVLPEGLELFLDEWNSEEKVA